MADSGSPQIGPHIQKLRKHRNLTLDNLAKLSGVSRSMLSQVERGQANPTLATVWALAKALKIDISDLIGGTNASEQHVRIELASPSFTPEIRTEDGMCVLRILSPADRADSIEWYELNFMPGGALVSDPHARGTSEHLTVLEGSLTVSAASQRSIVPSGATARYPADIHHEIRNESDGPARALLVMLS